MTRLLANADDGIDGAQRRVEVVMNEPTSTPWWLNLRRNFAQKLLLMLLRWAQ